MSKTKTKVIRKYRIDFYLGIDNLSKVRFALTQEYDAEKERLRYRYELRTTIHILKRHTFITPPISEEDYKYKKSLTTTPKGNK